VTPDAHGLTPHFGQSDCDGDARLDQWPLRAEAADSPFFKRLGQLIHLFEGWGS